MQPNKISSHTDNFYFNQVSVRAETDIKNFYLEKQKSFIPKKKFLSSCQYQNKKLCLSTQFFVKVLVEIYNIITGFGLELHCIVSSRDLEVSK